VNGAFPIRYRDLSCGGEWSMFRRAFFCASIFFISRVKSATFCGHDRKVLTKVIAFSRAIAVSRSSDALGG
jgi:hypothetical protein